MLKDYGTAAHSSLIFALLPSKSLFTQGLLAAESDPSQLWLSRILLQRLQTQWFPAWVFLAVNLDLYPTINAWMRLLSTACPSQMWKKSTFDFRGCQITLTFPKKSQNLESVSWWHQFHQIKRKYCFTKVSYKFLLQTMLIFLQNMAGEVLLKLCKNPR